MTSCNHHIQYLLQQLCIETDSDMAAVGIVDFEARKLDWHYIWGSASTRTERIKQRVNRGLTGEVLRTGSFIQLVSGADNNNFAIGESIMMTEKLNAAAGWPVMGKTTHYHGTVMIGNRTARLYKPIQIVQAASTIKQLEKTVDQALSSQAIHQCY